MSASPLQFTADDLQPMEGFPWAWRWTDPSRANVEADALEHIRPLTPAAASRVLERSSVLQGKEYPARFEEIADLDVGLHGRFDEHRDGITREWLARYVPESDDPVVVSYDERHAMLTTGAIFVRHWDTFCFPVEDVVIFPLSEEWTLAFDYKQRFYFARARR